MSFPILACTIWSPVTSYLGLVVINAVKHEVMSLNSLIYVQACCKSHGKTTLLQHLMNLEPLDV